MKTTAGRRRGATSPACQPSTRSGRRPREAAGSLRGFCLAVLVACLCALGCHKDAGPLLEQGDRLLALGDYKQAIVQYQSALALGPNAHAHRGLGLAYEALSAYTESERHLEAALAARPEDADARVALARIHTQFGRYAPARELLAQVIERSSDHLPALLLQGIYAETRPQVQTALEQLEAHVERQKRLGHSISHDTQLVMANLMARLNRAAAARRMREGVRYTTLGATRLTLQLARAAAGRDNHELSRDLLAPLVERHPSELDAWLGLAEAAVELRRFDEARRAMKPLRSRLGEVRVRLLRARLELAGGLQTEALRELRELLEELPGHRRPERAQVRRFLAHALALAGRDEEARAELEQLLAEYPRHADGTLALAELHLARGEPDQAVKLLAALTDHHGRLERGYELLGRAQLEAGDADAAEQAFRRLWELSPHEPEARYLLSMSLLARNQRDQARRLLEGNLKRFPDHLESLSELVELVEKTQGVRAAGSFVRQYGQRHASSPAVATFEARWLMERRHFEEALTAYRRALSVEPSAFQAARDLAAFYVRRGKAELAQSVLDSAIAHDARNPAIHLLAARVASDLGRYHQAKESCEKALELSPGHPLALAQLAELQAEAFKNSNVAQKLAARAYESAPGNAKVNAALGWVTHLAGDSQQAIPYLDRARALAPDDARVHYQLGAALLSAGRVADARKSLARVLELDPLFPTASEIRTVLARR